MADTRDTRLALIEIAQEAVARSRWMYGNEAAVISVTAILAHPDEVLAALGLTEEDVPDPVAVFLGRGTSKRVYVRAVEPEERSQSIRSGHAPPKPRRMQANPGPWPQHAEEHDEMPPRCWFATCIPVPVEAEEDTP